MFGYAPPSLAHSKVVIVLVTMPGCGHCEEFKPRVARIAQKYQAIVPVVHIDASAARTQAFCDQYKIEAVPVMMLMKKGTAHVARAEGSVENGVIEQFFYTAAMNAR